MSHRPTHGVLSLTQSRQSNNSTINFCVGYFAFQLGGCLPLTLGGGDQFQPTTGQKPTSYRPNCHGGTVECYGVQLQILCTLYLHAQLTWKQNKKLSYRRETARQLPTWRGARPSSPLPRRPLWLHLCVWSNPKPATNVRH